VIVDLVEDDRQRETSIHQRLERNWLASLHIPFSTLVHNARVSNLFVFLAAKLTFHDYSRILFVDCFNFVD